MDGLDSRLRGNDKSVGFIQTYKGIFVATTFGYNQHAVMLNLFQHPRINLERLLKKRCPEADRSADASAYNRGRGPPRCIGAALKVPQDWGIQGVDSDFFSSLLEIPKQVRNDMKRSSISVAVA